MNTPSVVLDNDEYACYINCCHLTYKKYFCTCYDHRQVCYLNDHRIRAFQTSRALITYTYINLASLSSYGCQLPSPTCSHGSLAIHSRRIAHLMSETEGHGRLLEVRSNRVSESKGSQERVVEGGELGMEE